MYREIIMSPEKKWNIILLMAVLFSLLGYVLPRLF